MEDTDIKLKAVATNNLKDIDIKFPLEKLTVVTGVSGSGKSSLVFETLYGEAYRRYVSSLSSYARQYLKVLPRPKMESCENLPPAVSVAQSRGGGNFRSTVGSLSELSELMKMIFVKIGKIVCNECGKTIQKDTPASIYKELLSIRKGSKIVIAAPAKAWEGMNPNDLKTQLEVQGFTRVLHQKKFIRVEEVAPKNLLESAVVVDRLSLEESKKDRILDSFEVALRLGKGEAYAIDESMQMATFSDRLECCGIQYYPPSQSLLSYNHPLGACGTCQGYGREATIHWDKVFPEKESSIASRGIAPLNFGKHDSYYEWIEEASGFSSKVLKKRFADYTEIEWETLKFGNQQDFDGVQGYFDWLESKKYKPHYRMHAARFRKYVTCTTCHGARMNPKALAIKVDDKNLAEVGKMSISQLIGWLQGVKNNYSHQKKLLVDLLEEAFARLGYLERVGLSYLNLERAAPTLSGGELQRIQMARCLGSSLTQTLFCLDEPTVGLHARDIQKLVGVIEDLRDQGNTVVTVEHNQQIMHAADQVLEIGPAAGHLGGRVTFQGKLESLTDLKSFAEVKKIDKLEIEDVDFIELKGATTHNLKSCDLSLPIGRFSAVCGVSGSGKTSLIQHTLYPATCEAIDQEVDKTTTPPEFSGMGPKELNGYFDEVLLVSQQALGRSSRSNIATYLDIYGDIRKLLSKESGVKGLSPSYFSFNTKGGRCEECQGLGTVVEDLSFLGEMRVTCPSCEGRRFNEKVLNVKLRGKNLLDILDLTALEAMTFFNENNKIRKALQLVVQVGLGYLTLGQSTSSFSGGEAQRLKLLKLLTKAQRGKNLKLLILDEPSAGLSKKDVSYLIKQFRSLCDIGHTVVVIEHNLDVIKASDWVVELGPDAAHNGGEIVFQGRVSELQNTNLTPTSEILSSLN